MPSFKKRSLSLYLRNGCERQFILYLYNDIERTAHNMPSRQQRSGLGLVGKAGYDWQIEKVDELKDIFGTPRIHENPIRGAHGPEPIQLSAHLAMLQPHHFVIEGAYEADTPTFRSALGMSTLHDFYGDLVDIGDTRPDIIQVLPSMLSGGSPNVETDPNPYEMGVHPNGYLFPLLPDDPRLRLRIIDVKLTSEPGANYFAEVVYYSMTLAAWLIENQADDRFVVVGAPAIWPGKHEASELAKEVDQWRRRGYIPSDYELINAFELDLEIATFDIFAPRIRTLLSEELPDLLSRTWEDLAWHVDYRCKGCEFLSLGKPDGETI
jgi:hypothetical protein